jgi:transcriptional regulator with XRE-family HTH domain
MANFEIIRDLCENRGITIRALASRVGLTDVSVHQLIKKGSTNTATLEAIAKELDVSAGCFFGASAEPVLPASPINDLHEIIKSQQRTIENLSETVKLLTNK